MNTPKFKIGQNISFNNSLYIIVTIHNIENKFSYDIKNINTYDVFWYVDEYLLEFKNNENFKFKNILEKLTTEYEMGSIFNIFFSDVETVYMITCEKFEQKTNSITFFPETVYHNTDNTYTIKMRKQDE